MNTGRRPSSSGLTSGGLPADLGEGSGTGGHDGVGMMRWLLTYADLITLLMAFFVVMYALSRVDLARYRKLASSLQGVLGYGGGGGGGGAGGSSGSGPGHSGLGLGPGPGPDAGLAGGTGFFAPAPDDSPAAPSARTSPTGLTSSALNELEQSVRAVARKLEANGLVSVRVQSEGMAVIISDVALFPTASAELTPAAGQFLHELTPSLVSLPNLLQVRGYTDDRPIRTPQYPSNWELSLARAVSVLRALVAAGIPVERLSAAGFGPLHPVASNQTAAGRARNRRVEIVVLQPPPPSHDSATPPPAMDKTALPQPQPSSSSRRPATAAPPPPPAGSPSARR